MSERSYKAAGKRKKRTKSEREMISSFSSSALFVAHLTVICPLTHLTAECSAQLQGEMAALPLVPVFPLSSLLHHLVQHLTVVRTSS